MEGLLIMASIVFLILGILFLTMPFEKRGNVFINPKSKKELPFGNPRTSGKIFIGLFILCFFLVYKIVTK